MTHTKLPSRGWQAVLLSIALAATALSIGTVVVLIRAVDHHAPEGLRDVEASERRVIALERRLTRLQEREAFGEWIQQEIRRANPRLDDVEAREYGRLLLETTERYSVDPLFLLAVGVVESRFNVRATSHADAKGLYQIWPATGRWLAGDLGWEYSEEMLYHPAVSTELAALYLDKLFDRYGDPRLVLAEYNGGPVNARRLRNRSPRLAPETRDYVTKVMTVLDGLNERRDVAPDFASERDEPVRVAMY